RLRLHTETQLVLRPRSPAHQPDSPRTKPGQAAPQAAPEAAVGQAVEEEVGRVVGVHQQLRARLRQVVVGVEVRVVVPVSADNECQGGQHLQHGDWQRGDDEEAGHEQQHQRHLPDAAVQRLQQQRVCRVGRRHAGRRCGQSAPDGEARGGVAGQTEGPQLLTVWVAAATAAKATPNAGRGVAATRGAQLPNDEDVAAEDDGGGDQGVQGAVKPGQWQLQRPQQLRPDVADQVAVVAGARGRSGGVPTSSRKNQGALISAQAPASPATMRRARLTAVRTDGRRWRSTETRSMVTAAVSATLVCVEAEERKFRQRQEPVLQADEGGQPGAQQSGQQRQLVGGGEGQQAVADAAQQQQGGAAEPLQPLEGAIDGQLVVDGQLKACERHAWLAGGGRVAELLGRFGSSSGQANFRKSRQPRLINCSKLLRHVPAVQLNLLNQVTGANCRALNLYPSYGLYSTRKSYKIRALYCPPAISRKAFYTAERMAGEAVEEDEVPSIVLDSGSSRLRAGFAGDDSPCLTMPAVIGRRGSPHQRPEVLVGDDALSTGPVPQLGLTQPVQRGVLVDFDDAELLWRHAIEAGLRADPEQHPLLLAEPPLNPKCSREAAVQLLFESLGAPAVYLANASSLAMYASGRGSAVMLSCGDGVSHAEVERGGGSALLQFSWQSLWLTPRSLWLTPKLWLTPVIYEGYVVACSTRRVDCAGGDVTDAVRDVLRRRGCCLETPLERQLAADFKERLFRVSRRAADFDSPDGGDDAVEEFELPDGRGLVGLSRRDRAEPWELLLGRSNPARLQRLVAEALSSADIDTRADLWRNVIVSGGSTMADGFVERLTAELTELAPPAATRALDTAPDPAGFRCLGGGGNSTGWRADCASVSNSGVPGRFHCLCACGSGGGSYSTCADLCNGIGSCSAAAATGAGSQLCQLYPAAAVSFTGPLVVAIAGIVLLGLTVQLAIHFVRCPVPLIRARLRSCWFASPPGRLMRRRQRREAA
uniref:Protein kinase domain-containing protein n=1 Tax=Macrostomum lignano TaxID=282301 RepID=A0A1I8JL67_9PLAT